VGSFDADDTELRKKSLLRLGNEFIPMDNYGKAIEGFMQPILNEIFAPQSFQPKSSYGSLENA
jgi:Deoxyhypusine synthase